MDKNFGGGGLTGLRKAIVSSGMIGVDQNTAGTLLDFSLRTAMHGTSRISSALSVSHN